MVWKLRANNRNWIAQCARVYIGKVFVRRWWFFSQPPTASGLTGAETNLCVFLTQRAHAASAIEEVKESRVRAAALKRRRGGTKSARCLRAQAQISAPKLTYCLCHKKMQSLLSRERVLPACTCTSQRFSSVASRFRRLHKTGWKMATTQFHVPILPAL